MEIDKLRNLELMEFPLPDGGILYFSPQSVGLLESDEVMGEIIKKSREFEDIDSLAGSLSGKYPDDYIRYMLKTLKELTDQGIIGGVEEEAPKKPGFIKRIIISNTGACNLACKYCYNRFEENRDAFSDKISLNSQQIEKTMKTLASISKDWRELELLFIGGEPLLRFDLIKEAAKLRMTLPELKNKYVRIFLITNATLLTNEILDFCSNHNIHIKISLDGSREIHDKTRVFPDGKGSYNKILAKLPRYFTGYAHPCKAVTATVDSFNADLVSMVEHFTSLGFNQIELTELYGCNSDCTGLGLDDCTDIITVAEKDRLKKNYRELCDFLYFKIRSRQYLNLIPFYDPLFYLHTRRKTHFPCRAGMNSVALFSDGLFYPCHHYMGDKNFITGDLEKGLDPQRFDKIAMPVNKREKCKNCWAKFLCGGECYHRAMVEARDMYSGYDRGCFRRKTLFREIIYLYHRLREDDPQSLRWYFSVNMYP